MFFEYRRDRPRTYSQCYFNNIPGECQHCFVHTVHNLRIFIKKTKHLCTIHMPSNQFHHRNSANPRENASGTAEHNCSGPLPEGGVHSRNHNLRKAHHEITVRTARGPYHQGEDGLLYPNLLPPAEDTPTYGKYGRRCHTYLKEHRPPLHQPASFQQAERSSKCDR